MPCRSNIVVLHIRRVFDVLVRSLFESGNARRMSFQRPVTFVHFIMGLELPAKFYKEFLDIFSYMILLMNLLRYDELSPWSSTVFSFVYPTIIETQ